MDSKSKTNPEKSSKKKRAKSEFKNLLINIGLVIAGFLIALGVFIVYKNNERQRELNSLIPNAKAAYNSGDYSTSINLFQNAEKEFPNDNEIKEYLGKLYYQKAKYQDSANYFELFQKSSTLANDDIDQLGNAYIKLNQNEKLIALWKDADLKPQNRYKLANVYLSNKDYDNYFLELSKIKTYKEPLIYSQIKETSLQDIIDNLNNASSLPSISDEEIDLDLFKAQITESKKQADAGKKEYSELIQLVAYSNISQCQFITTRLANLRTSLDSQKIPSYQVDFIDGKCANQRNEPDAAIPLINKAISSDVSNIEYREELAKSYFLKNAKDDLKSTFDDIFVIKKTSDLIKSYAGYLYKLGDKNEAINQYKEAFKLSGTSEQKEKIAKLILQISFLDSKSLEICKDNDTLSALDTNLMEDYFLKSNCDIFNNKSISDSNFNDIKVNYIKALARKDKNAIEKILDSDNDGYVTSYYNGVGYQLMQ